MKELAIHKKAGCINCDIDRLLDNGSAMTDVVVELGYPVGCITDYEIWLNPVEKKTNLSMNVQTKEINRFFF